MQNRKLAGLAIVIVAAALLHASWAMAGETTPAVKQALVIKNYECSSEGTVILPIGVPPVATVEQTRGTLTMTGINLGNLTAGQFLLSVTDPNPTAKPGVPTVESCYYTTSSSIVYGGPPFPTGRFWTLTPSFSLDVPDSGPDCPNPLSSSPFLLALTHFQDDKLAGIVGTHFIMTTLDVPDVSMTFTCQRQEVLPQNSINWPE